MDNALAVPNPYPLYSDLSGDYCYPTSQSRSWILLTGYVDRFIFSLILTEFRGTRLEIERNSHQKWGSLYSRKLPFVYLSRSWMIVPSLLKWEADSCKNLVSFSLWKLETSFGKKIRAREARMILTGHNSTSWLPQYFLFVRQVICICVKFRYHVLRTFVRARVSLILF